MALSSPKGSRGLLDPRLEKEIDTASIFKPTPNLGIPEAPSVGSEPVSHSVSPYKPVRMNTVLENKADSSKSSNPGEFDNFFSVMLLFDEISNASSQELLSDTEEDTVPIFDVKKLSPIAEQSESPPSPQLSILQRAASRAGLQLPPLGVAHESSPPKTQYQPYYEPPRTSSRVSNHTAATANAPIGHAAAAAFGSRSAGQQGLSSSISHQQQIPKQAGTVPNLAHEVSHGHHGKRIISNSGTVIHYEVGPHGPSCSFDNRGGSGHVSYRSANPGNGAGPSRSGGDGPSGGGPPNGGRQGGDGGPTGQPPQQYCTKNLGEKSWTFSDDMAQAYHHMRGPAVNELNSFGNLLLYSRKHSMPENADEFAQGVSQ
jgi:hypothetical protein